MVATRSSSNASPAATPQKTATIGGRVEKKKKASKLRKRSSGATRVEDLEFESQLMKEAGIGEMLFSRRSQPPWIQYTGPCFMGLPRDVRDKVVNFILPICERPELQAKNNNTQPARASDSEENLVGPFFDLCRPFFGRSYVHPILWTCRQLRYEYGQLFLTNNQFTHWVPQAWDSTHLTHFTQHAASVGAPRFPLFMDLDTCVYSPGHKCYPHAPLPGECRDHLDRWMKRIYYGVETRVLFNDYPLRQDSGLIAHFLHQAQQYRDRGKSWEQLLASLEEAWDAFAERRGLAEANVGKDVAAMTALYKVSNERLEKARAVSLGAGGMS